MSLSTNRCESVGPLLSGRVEFAMKVAISLEEMSLGGGPKYTLTLGQYLAEAGHDVTIVVERPGVWWSEIARRGLASFCLPTQPCEPTVQRACRLAHFLNEGRFNVVIINASLLNHVAHHACHMLEDRIKVLFIMHGDWDAMYELAAREVAAWNCAVGVSPKIQRKAIGFFPEKPVFSISNGVEVPTQQQLQSRTPWELPLRLLFVGRLIDSHKGVFRLPLILASCRRRNLPVELTVVGDGEDRAGLIQRFENEGVSDLVVMTGSLGPDASRSAMLGHHVLLLPTNMEGMPLVVLEAQTSGCVCIVTHLPGITDVAVDNGVSGRLAGRGNIEEFVDHIEAMLDQNVWQQTSQAAIERSQRLFSHEAMGVQYDRILQDLALNKYPLQRPYNKTRSLRSVPFYWWNYFPRVPAPAFFMNAVGAMRKQWRKLRGRTLKPLANLVENS